jgi:hypothetical protein
MAVEQQASADRQIVALSWDTERVTGEVVQLRCVNPENGDVSVSGLSKNDGEGYVTYPLGYSGSTFVTVQDNDGNEDSGMISVGDAEPPEVDIPEFPQPPIEIPDLPDGIWGPTDPRPTPPIVIAPGLGDDFWTGNLPPSAQPVNGE